MSLGPLLEGASGGGVHGARVGGEAAVEGVLDALTVLVGDAGGQRGQEAVGWCLMDRRWRVLQGHKCFRSKCPIRAIIGHFAPAVSSLFCLWDRCSCRFYRSSCVCDVIRCVVVGLTDNSHLCMSGYWTLRFLFLEVGIMRLRRRECLPFERG